MSSIVFSSWIWVEAWRYRKEVDGVPIGLQNNYRFAVICQRQALCSVQSDLVADLSLIYQVFGISVEHLVSCIVVICLIPNFIDQHDVSRFKLHMLQLIYIFPGKCDVNLFFLVDVLVDLIEIIVLS